MALRDEWLNPPGLPEKELAKRTLADLYNQRPDWLAEAHAELDAVAKSLPGWPVDLSNKEILDRLLAENLRRAGYSGMAVSEGDESE